ncbi:MAG: hypothetical protein ONB44_03445 [candidate division KSB1 bacterium]|nr:hypothetical protein [candidate division KSB1 bacterium]MDZ7301182.1 hypothetical protein [candidate division KSB1 bacterium]MDZ7310594.1 hypothetical protein [candidate division KSB1 bacterium]
MDLKEIAKHYLTIAAGLFIGGNLRFAFEPEFLTIRNVFLGILNYLVVWAVGLFSLWKAGQQKSKGEEP